MKPSTKIVLAIVVLLAVAYGVLAVLSSGDGLPEAAEDAAAEQVVTEEAIEALPDE